MESAAFFTSLFKHAVQEIPNKSINLCFAFTLYGVYRSCEILQKENNAFMSFVYLYLNTLTKRAFGPGETFRGTAIDDTTQYKNILKTRALQSTSKIRQVAEEFIGSFKHEIGIDTIIYFV